MTDVATAALVDDGDGLASSEAEPLRARAWSILRRNPFFWFSSVVIVILIAMAVVPGLFTTIDPRDADLSRTRETPNGDAWFGRDTQGYDIFSRCIYGARASILVGILTTTVTATVGVIVGLVAGYINNESIVSRRWAVRLPLLGSLVIAIVLHRVVGGWELLTVAIVIGVVTAASFVSADTFSSRVAEVFFAIPLMLGAIILLQSVSLGSSYTSTILQVVMVLSILGWPSIFRLMRSTVLQVKPNDYIQAARALGASSWRICFRHILPNAIGPVIVVSTINLGVFIAAEASLSFLGIGLVPPTVSWGVMINQVGVGTMRNSPHVLLFPAVFLSITVLAFIMLGDAIRDAFDPKSH